MRPLPLRTTLKPLRAALFAAALGHLALFLCVSCLRLAYPYQLDWTEGGIADHVVRVLQGRPVYVEPSLEFTPFIYTPLYYYVSAAAACLTGPGFLPLRLVSLGSALGCMALLAALVRREARAWAPALLAACFYAAAFPLSGYWHDVGRPDSLLMLLLLGGIYVFRGARGPAALALAGVLLALAYLAKQTALLPAMALAACSLLLLPWRHKAIFPAVWLVLVLLATAALNRATRGWFGFYAFTLPRQHEIDWFLLKRFWIDDMGRPLVIALGFMLLLFARLHRERRWRDLAFFGLLAAGMIGAAWASRSHSFGFLNGLLPAHAFLAVALGLALGRYVPGLFGPGVPAPPPSGRGQERLLLLLCILQFALLYYNPIPQIPTRADRRAGDRVVSRIRACAGDVFIPYHGYLGWMAGKPIQAHGLALLDVIRGGDPVLARKVEKELHAAYATHRYAAIITDGDWYNDDVERYYDSAEQLLYKDSEFFTFIGMRTRPVVIYEPRRPPGTAAHPEPL